MATVAELQAALSQKQGEWQAKKEEALKCEPGQGHDIVTDLKARNDEMTQIGKELDALLTSESVEAEIKARDEQMSKVVNRKVPFQAGASDGNGAGYVPTDGVNSGRLQATKSLADALLGDKDYQDYAKSFVAGGSGAARIRFDSMEASINSNIKATYDNTSGALTGYDRQPGIVAIEQQRLFIIDMLMQGTTTQPTIRYLQENSFSNEATAVAEGTTKPEAAFDLIEKDAPVRKIAVTAKVTDEQLADFSFIRNYMNTRMDYKVRARAEALVLNGNGVSPNMLGIMQTSGIQTQAKGSDPVMDAVYRAITKIRVNGFFSPDAIVIHPNDWADTRLLRTADGLYIWGSPADAGPERMWGLPLAVTTAITENTGLVGAFRYGAQFFLRQGVTMEATNSNEDDFKKNLVALRVEMRGALAVYRPLAFCTVTGI